MVDTALLNYLEFIRTDSRYRETNLFYTATDALLNLTAEMVNPIAQGEATSTASLRVQQEEPPNEREERKQQTERLPVLEMLRKYGLGEQREHLLLAGKPGSGKSTTLRRLCVEMAEIALVDDRQPMPVLVQLKGDKPILELIQAEFRRAKLRVTQAQIDDWLLADKLVLLLDGVNEIPSENLRRQLQDFRENNLTTPTIFTTRDLTVGGSLGIDRRLEMRPLTDEQMREFVGKYLPESGDRLLGQLQDRLREVAETPLLLKMLCEVFEPETGRIPQNKAELFELFDRQYQRHKEGVPVAADFRRFQSEILQYLAFTMLQGDAQKPTEAWLTLPRSKAENILEIWLKERHETNPASKAKEWLEDLLEHHLLQVAADPNQIEFHHQLFQEYYAARHLRSMLESKDVDLLDETRLKHFYLNYLKWTEPLGFLLGLLDDQDQAIRLVNLGLAVDLVLGAKLAGNVKPEFHRYLIETLNTKSQLTWFKIYLLGCTGSKAAKAPLLNFLESDDLDTAIQAVSSLERLNDSQIVPALKARLGKIEKWVETDIQSVLLLKEPGGKRLCDKAVELEVKLVKLLIELSPGDAKQIIDDYYLENSKGFIDYFICEEEIGDLITRYARTTQENIDKRLLTKLRKTTCINDISRLVNILFGLKSREVSAILIEKLNNTQDNQCFGVIIDLLGKFDNEDSSKALAELVGHSDLNIRNKAGKALTDSQRLNAIPFLEPILKDRDFYIRWGASIVLAELGAEIAIEILIEGLNHEKHEIRSQSAKSIGDLTFENISYFLIKALEDPTYSVRRSAAIALAQSGSEAAIPELLQALRNYVPDDPKLADSVFDFELSDNDKLSQGREGYSIRGVNTETIKIIGDYDGIKQYVDEKRFHRREIIKQEIIHSLSQFNVKIVREGLYESLQQGNTFAATALAQFGDVEMAPHLIEMLCDDVHGSHFDRISALLANLIDNAESSMRDFLISDIITRLNKLGHDNNYYFRNRLTIVLLRVNSIHLAQYLSELRMLFDTRAGQQALWIIESVQFNCKFYNYDVFCSPPHSIQPLPIESIVNNISGDYVAGDKPQGDKIIGNKYNNIDKVGNLNTGTVTIHGNQIGSQQTQEDP